MSSPRLLNLNGRGAHGFTQTNVKVVYCSPSGLCSDIKLSTYFVLSKNAFVSPFPFPESSSTDRAAYILTRYHCFIGSYQLHYLPLLIVREDTQHYLATASPLFRHKTLQYTDTILVNKESGSGIYFKLPTAREQIRNSTVSSGNKSWKVALVVPFKALSHHLLGESYANHEKSQKGRSPGRGTKQGPPETWSTSDNQPAAPFGTQLKKEKQSLTFQKYGASSHPQRSEAKIHIWRSI
jgi:hypothetical protein